jgi:hypothetical protein
VRPVRPTSPLVPVRRRGLTMPRKSNDDPKVPESQVIIRDFGGLISNEDPHDLPPGAAIKQVNAQSIRPGELRARPGTKIVQFDV